MTVTSIATEGGKLISGSKDQKIAIISIGTGGNFKLDKLIDLATIPILTSLPLVVPKSVDYFNGNLLVGFRNGTVIQIKGAIDAEPKEP